MILFNSYDNKKEPALFTPFSIIHITNCILLTYFLLYCSDFNSKYIITTVVIVFVLHTIYEIIDYYNTYINVTFIKQFSWKNNSLYNSIGDTICCIIGICIALWICNYYKLFNILTKPQQPQQQQQQQHQPQQQQQQQHQTKKKIKLQFIVLIVLIIVNIICNVLLIIFSVCIFEKEGVRNDFKWFCKYFG
tara:strand:- start:442 stop:1014 length:573 start_codon:yes stop_codon:yes gene_type:complete